MLCLDPGKESPVPNVLVYRMQLLKRRKVLIPPCISGDMNISLNIIGIYLLNIKYFIWHLVVKLWTKFSKSSIILTLYLIFTLLIIIGWYIIERDSLDFRWRFSLPIRILKRYVFKDIFCFKFAILFLYYFFILSMFAHLFCIDVIFCYLNLYFV